MYMCLLNLFVHSYMAIKVGKLSYITLVTVILIAIVLHTFITCMIMYLSCEVVIKYKQTQTEITNYGIMLLLLTESTMKNC